MRSQTDRVVDNAAEQRRSDDREWKLRNNFGPEVGRASVHVVVHFSQEHRALVWEDQDHVLDRVERDVHRNEEQCSLSVLHTRLSLRDIPEQQRGECGSHAGRKELHVRSLGETDDVKEVSLSKQPPLVAKAGGNISLTAVFNRVALGVFSRVVVAQVAFVVLGYKQSDSFLVDLFDASTVMHKRACFVCGIVFNALNRHHRHEEISRVRQVWALEADRAEVVD